MNVTSCIRICNEKRKIKKTNYGWNHGRERGIGLYILQRELQVSQKCFVAVGVISAADCCYLITPLFKGGSMWELPQTESDREKSHTESVIVFPLRNNDIWNEPCATKPQQQGAWWRGLYCTLYAAINSWDQSSVPCVLRAEITHHGNHPVLQYDVFNVVVLNLGCFMMSVGLFVHYMRTGLNPNFYDTKEMFTNSFYPHTALPPYIHRNCMA